MLAVAPRPLWFATRGAGTATLILLTLSVVLGILSAGGARAPMWPRFLTAGLHRNLSLFTLVFLAVHIVTSVLDPFAKLGWRDATIPFVSVYRPFWLGLGVVCGELLFALAVTSLLRPLLGHQKWRATHWLAYASWPSGMLHALGTGTDARQPWSVGLATACIVAVVASLSWRLGMGSRRTVPLRAGIAVLMIFIVAGISAWAADGPLRPGWARRAGTPVSLMGGNVAAAKAPAAVAPASDLPAGVVQDPVTGTSIRQAGGQTRIVLTDQADRRLQIIVSTSVRGAAGPLVAIVHDGKVGCVTPAVIGDAIGAVCGKTRILIVLARVGSGDTLTGRLVLKPVS